jgi:Domain of unknown function (DUF5134)
MPAGGSDGSAELSISTRRLFWAVSVPGPSWLRWGFVAAFLAVAGYSVVRLVAAHRATANYRGCHRALDVAHLVMGAGMAAMLSPAGGPIPAAGWQTAFVLLAAWFLGSAWHCRRTGSRAEPIGWHGGGLHHAIAALAMLYMLSGGPADGSHRAMPWMHAHQTGLEVAPLSWVLAAYFAGCAVVFGPRLVRAPEPAGARIPALLRAPRITATCQVAMALGMAYMIVPVD